MRFKGLTEVLQGDWSFLDCVMLCNFKTPGGGGSSLNSWHGIVFSGYFMYIKTVTAVLMSVCPHKYGQTLTECLPERFLPALLCFSLTSHSSFHQIKSDIWRPSVYNGHNARLAISHIWKTNKVTHQSVQIDLFTSNNTPKWHFGLDYLLLKQCS